MQIRMEVTSTDGKPVQVTVGAADLIALEEQFDIDASELATRQRMKWLAFLAWHALKRRGNDVGTFDTWVEGLEQVTPQDTSEGEG